jgi:hypothetical protein
MYSLDMYGVPLDMTPGMILREGVNYVWEVEYSLYVFDVPPNKVLK